MPIIDSSAIAGTDALPSRLQCDVCIVGAGPAGITIARELAASRLRVTILESGGTHRQPETDALNEIESVGWPRVMDQWLVRNRIAGGSSHTWAGRCAPFDEIDLQYRDWVPYSGWPFGVEELDPYLERSAKYLGLEAGRGFMGDRFWPYRGHRSPKFDTDPEKLLPMVWQYSHDPSHRDTGVFNRDAGVRFGQGFSADLPANVVLVTNATVLRINATKCGTGIESVDFSSIGGSRWSLEVSTVVVSAGGIENARLLLSSDNVVRQGLGNQKDLVGRFLMDHLRTPVARFEKVPNKAVISRFGMYRSRAIGGNLYQDGMRLSPIIQHSEQLLNCAVWVGEHIGSDDPWNLLAHLLRSRANSREDLVTILKNSPLMARSLAARFITHRGIPRKLDEATLIAMCEQLPNPDSRLTLSDRRDRFGMRITRIDWRVSEEEARVLRRIAELAAEQFLHQGLEPPSLEEWVLDKAMFPKTALDSAHPTGTTRMADDPSYGVVDTRCQVHGIEGLFIAGSSIFPTAGHANPTQMIVALALRLADTLKKRATTASAVLRSASDFAIHDTEL